MNNKSAVFVVDDDPEVRKSLLWLLESDGLRVMSYSSADEFIEGLTQNICDCCFEEPANACLVLDLKMPGMGGLELQHFLAQHCPCLPVIIVSGQANDHQIEQAMTAGAIAFIKKPFIDGLLLENIQKILPR